MSARYTQSMALTPRHLEALALIAQGYSNPEIAEAMFVSTSTVQQYIADIYARMGARSRAHCIHLAHLRGVPSVVNAPAAPPGPNRRKKVAVVKPIALSGRRG